MRLKGFRNAIIGIGFVVVASCTAEATLLSPSVFNFNDQSTANIITQVGSSIAGSGEAIISLLRLDNLAAPPAGSDISVTYGAAGTATISWDLVGTGKELEGVYVFGGSAANLYGVSSDEELTGSGSITTPLNNGGQTPGISHLLFLGTGTGSPPVPTAPDAANTSILLGASLIGLSLFRRRYLKQAY